MHTGKYKLRSITAASRSSCSSSQIADCSVHGQFRDHARLTYIICQTISTIASDTSYLGWLLISVLKDFTSPKSAMLGTLWTICSTLSLSLSPIWPWLNAELRTIFCESATIDLSAFTVSLAQLGSNKPAGEARLLMDAFNTIISVRKPQQGHLSGDGICKQQVEPDGDGKKRSTASPLPAPGQQLCLGE